MVNNHVRGLLFVGAALVSLGLTACGGDDTSSRVDRSSTTVGGASTSTDIPPYYATDQYAARAISVTVSSLITFLWNRDLFNLPKGSLSNSANCLLAGEYAAVGQTSFNGSGCSGSATRALSFTFTACEHDGENTGDFVTFTGTVSDKDSETYAGSCVDSTSNTATFSATGLTVVFRHEATDGGEDYVRTFDACDIELNKQLAANDGSLAGRVCGLPVSVKLTAN